MPKGLGSFGPSVAGTALTSAIPSASFTGILQGFKNGSIKSSELFEKCTKAENFLKSIQEAIKILNCDVRNIDGEFSGLNIFQDALNGGDVEFFPLVNSTRKNLAMIPEIISEGIASIASHGLQFVSDSLIASKVVSDAPCPPLIDDIFLPSKLEGNARANFFACCKHFSNRVNPSDHIDEKVQAKFVDGGGSMLDSHESSAASSAHTTFGVSIGIPSLIMSGLWDTVGSSLRNLHASMKYTTNIEKEEEKVIVALASCVHSLSETKPSKESCFASLEHLNCLISALVDIDPMCDQISNDLVTDAKPISKLLSFTAVPFISSLKLVVNSALGLILANEVVEKKLASPGSTVLTQRASSIEGKPHQQNSRSHSENISSLTQQFKNINQALNILIAEDEKLHQSASDASSVLAVGGASTLTHSVTLLLPLLLLELGSITQETAAGIKFGMNSSNKIFHECDLVSQSNDNTGEELDLLFKEAINTKDALEMMKDLGNSSPMLLGISRAGICGTAVGTLTLLLGAYAAIKEFRSAPDTIRALRERSEFKEEEKKLVADSLNEVKASHQKASSALSTSAPKQLTAESALESILKKVILTGCMSQSEVKELKDRKDLNSVAKVSIQAENSIASGATRFGGFLTGALSAIAFVALESGIGTEALLRAFGNTLTDMLHSYEHIKESSEGPDKIKLSSNSNTNLSSLSNALRLLAAAKSDDLPSTQKSVFSGVKLSESITSRSFTIFLMHSGILIDAILNVVRRHENQDDKTQSVRRTKASAHEEVMSALAQEIEQKLNGVDAKAIPGLNKDIAAQLQSFSQQRIVSALTTEMILVEPFLILGELSKAGSRADAVERRDHEALIDCTPGRQASILSNMIQGFTLAWNEEATRTHGNEDQSLLKTHDSSGSMFKTSLMTSGYLSLTLVEIIGTFIGRSFTLLNWDRVKAHSVEISEHSNENLKGNLHLSTEETKADSHYGEKESAIYSISALRSTLSHFSAALKGCADDMVAEISKKGHENFIHGDCMKDDIRMHSSQRRLMHAIATAFTHCASLLTRMSAAGSGLSFSHIILLGKVDKLHDLLHSRDDSLELHQGKSSQECTHSSRSEISMATGLSTDLIASSITNIIKILLSASLIGADVLLSVAKILEIIILDVHPSIRLQHEWQALSVPDIKSGGASEALNRVLRASELIPTISTGQLSVSHDAECSRSTLEDSLHSLQNKVDNLIDHMQVLEDKSESKDNDQKENVVTLKKYIFQIIKTLHTNLSDDECLEFINRLDKGGIALSGYHSQFGGVLNFTEAKEDRVLQTLRNSELEHIHNTNVLIAKFTDDIFEKYSQFLKKSRNDDPLNKFIQSFNSSLTPTTLNLHRYIIRGVANKLYESHNLIHSTFWHSPKISFNRDGFIAKYSMQNSTHSDLVQPLDIESNILKAEEARNKRAEKRALKEQGGEDTNYRSLQVGT